MELTKLQQDMIATALRVVVAKIPRILSQEQIEMLALATEIETAKKVEIH
jgi:hypothetical protein